MELSFGCEIRFEINESGWIDAIKKTKSNETKPLGINSN